MELTSQRRQQPTAGFAHRTTLSPHTQSAATTTSGCGPSSQSRPSSLRSPPASAAGAPRRSSPAGSSGSRSAGLSSPTAAASPGTGPALLRQHSAPAGSQCRPSAARLARLNSSSAPSGPFKRPVKQRLSPFGRGPRAPPGTREGEFRPAQVAPPRAGEAGREFRPAPPPASDGATSNGVTLKQRTSEQRAVCGYQNNTRTSRKRDDKTAGVPHSAEVFQRRHGADGIYPESDKVRDNSTKMKSATELKTSSCMMKKTTERSQGDSMRPRRDQTSWTENYSRNSTSNKSASDECGSQSIQRREPRISGSTDKIPFFPGKISQQGEDENRNQLYTKWPMHGDGRQRSQFTSHSESDRSAPRQSVKRGNVSFPEERSLKKPRRCEPSWNSPDQSASCQSATTAPKTFSETNKHSTTNSWNENTNSYASHRGSYGSIRHLDQRQREEIKLKHRVGSMPETQRIPRPSHGAADQTRPFTPPFAGERVKRRPPLLPTPPSRFYSGGSPAVTTTTCLGETPPPLTQSVTVAAVGGHWATGMPLLPQLLEPLSPMSPLSVASPPSPALPLSPDSPPSPAAPSCLSGHRPLSPGRHLPSPPASPGPPTRRASDRIRPAADRHRPTSRLPDSDSDSDSDSADGRVSGRAGPSRRNAAGRPESRDETGLARFHTTHSDGRRIDGIDRGRPAGRPEGRCADGPSRVPPTADPPPVDRRPPRGGPTRHADRFDPERRCDGQYREQCGANEYADLPSSGLRQEEHRDAAVTCSGSGRTGDRSEVQRSEEEAGRAPRGRPAGGGAHDPPAATCWDCDEPFDTDCSAERADQLTSAGSQASPAAAERDLSIFTSEYLSELLQLQRRIMTSRDSAEMTRVLALLWETGQVRDTALYYDFDLCALDQGVVRQLQKCLS